MTFLTETAGPALTDTPSPGWIVEQIKEWTRRSPGQVAFVLDHENRVEEYRYADVLDHAGGVADGLLSLGIGRGDRVGILMENVPQWVFALLGAMQIGAITVPLATALPENSIGLIVQHAGCSLLISDETNWEKAVHVSDAVGCKRMLGRDFARGADTLTRDVSFGFALSGSRSAAAPSPEGRGYWSAAASDTALLIYTSGTTGNPKGVELTFDNLNHEIRGVVESLQFTPDERILSVLPFSHVLPLIANGLGPLCIGATVVFLSSISPQRITEAFHRQRISLFICVPQFFYMVHKRIFSQVAAQPFLTRTLFGWMKAMSHRFNNPALGRKLFAKIHKTIGPDLRIFASGGSHFDPKIAEDLNDLGYTVLQAYGLTETSAAATVTPRWANRIGTVGKPIRGVSIRIDEPNDKGIGEVLIYGPILMKGYYHAPDQTAAAIKEGWFRTGDLGFLDRDGNLSITGRSKDVIVLANGENVYPEELEAHYSKSPFIKEICILGTSDNGVGTGGGVLHAVVVADMDEFRRRGQTAIAEMIRFDIETFSKEVPSYYRIHSLAIRNDPLPRTVTRKLKRFEIEQEELERRRVKEARITDPVLSAQQDDARFRSGVGFQIAELVRQMKPDAGPLDASINIELDLGFDSLTRVELLGAIEARLGTHIDEHLASRIFTLGELIDAFEAAAQSPTAGAQSWKDILESAPEEVQDEFIFRNRPFLNPFTFGAMRLLRFLARVLMGLRCVGLEKLPQKMPYLLCPNHDSFLDGPFVASVLPRDVIYKVFILGYSDYWKSAFSRRLAQVCKIVPIDPNVNLVRAMQAGAVGLKQGRPLLIFPEGTRSIDGKVAEFKRGAAILAVELGVPVVPVGIRGTYEAWPRGGSFRLHPVEFHFGDPIDPKAFSRTADPYGALTVKLREQVKILAGE